MQNVVDEDEYEVMNVASWVTPQHKVGIAVPPPLVRM